MNYSEECNKLVKKLLKERLAIDEIKKLTDSDFVASVTKDEKYAENSGSPRYTVKLLDGRVYYIFEKQEKSGSFLDFFKFGKK